MNNEENKENVKIPSVVISKIKFNDGTELPLDGDDIVVFVGANNVGKSRALKDIRNDIIESSLNKVIIDEIQYKSSNFNEDSMRKYFKNNFVSDSNGNYEVVIDGNYSYGYTKDNLKNIHSDDKYFYKPFFSFLSTENRLNMTSPISFSYINDRLSFNIMEKLEKDKLAITKLNNILLSCFNRAVDIGEGLWQNSVSKMYKFGTKDEISESVNADTRKARCLLESFENLNEQGDGIRSAVAILSSLIVCEHSLHLIDEPETFLHPPQARILGNNIVELSDNKQCFISTHNIDLIKGILEKKSSRVKIVKIDREDNTNTFSLLDNESIVTIAADKNLKYSNILNGLFYKQVVLCENESDCKFYSAILEFVSTSIYQNTLFCAVGGKDQFKLLIPLLKKIKIDCLIIADLDLINDRNKLRDLLNSVEDNKYENIKNIHDEFLNLFEKETDNLIKKQSAAKQEILKLFTEDEYMPIDVANKIKNVLKNISNLKLLKTNGKFCLPAGSCVDRFNEILKELNSNSIFVVECGEMERFIIEVGLHGPAWVEEVFKRYPTLEEPEYNNAKDFIKKIFKITE